MAKAGLIVFVMLGVLVHFGHCQMAGMNMKALFDTMLANPMMLSMFEQSTSGGSTSGAGGPVPQPPGGSSSSGSMDPFMTMMMLNPTMDPSHMDLGTMAMMNSMMGGKSSGGSTGMGMDPMTMAMMANPSGFDPSQMDLQTMAFMNMMGGNRGMGQKTQVEGPTSEQCLPSDTQCQESQGPLNPRNFGKGVPEMTMTDFGQPTGMSSIQVPTIPRRSALPTFGSFMANKKAVPLNQAKRIIRKSINYKPKRSESKSLQATEEKPSSVAGINPALPAKKMLELMKNGVGVNPRIAKLVCRKQTCPFPLPCANPVITYKPETFFVCPNCPQCPTEAMAKALSTINRNSKKMA